ncbi:hypothetical protein BDV11DRAFT_90821 [Aspergillus similis]
MVVMSWIPLSSGSDTETAAAETTPVATPAPVTTETSPSTAMPTSSTIPARVSTRRPTATGGTGYGNKGTCTSSSKRLIGLKFKTTTTKRALKQALDSLDSLDAHED